MDYREFIFRIILSLILGFIIGLERQITGHQAGIRINILICMGTCFFVLFPIVNNSNEMFRVSSSIITGVGFLCSGVIYKEGAFTKGINTAATLWCTAAIGLLASTGNVLWSASAMGVLVISNLVFRPISMRIHPIYIREIDEKQYQISVICREEAEMEIRSMLINSNTEKKLYLYNLESSDVIGDKVEIFANYKVYGTQIHNAMEKIISNILKNELVVESGWKEI